MKTESIVKVVKNLTCVISIVFITINLSYSQAMAEPDTINSFMDSRDGHEIKLTKIGTQTWMVENLNYETPSGSLCYDNKPTNCDIYGKLYDWETAQKVCPLGWHLPDETDVVRLIEYLGGGDVAGGKMKEKGTIHWKRPNSAASNKSGFTALPGGSLCNGKFDYIGYMCTWWMSEEKNKTTGKSFTLSFDTGDLFIITTKKQNALSVRCLKD